MSLLAKTAPPCIAKAIGLPPDMAAGQTLVAASCEAMGIVPEPGATLPGRIQVADRLMHGRSGLGCVLKGRAELS